MGDRPVTVGSVRLGARRAVRKDHDVGVTIRRLKVIGIVVPVAFIVTSELVEQAFIERFRPDPGQLALGVVVVSSVFVFGTAMFFLIDRAHRVMLRQNQAMIAANAVFAAIRGDLDTDQIIDAALESVLASTGASGVAVTAPADDDVITWRKAASHGGEAVTDREDGAASTVLDIPLLAGSTSVGAMLLHLSAETGKPDWLTSTILGDISQQLGTTIQHAQLIADLQRRKNEGRALYDVLLQISRQTSPEETLSSVVGIARDQLRADEAVLCLTESMSGFAGTGGVGGVDGATTIAVPSRDEPVCVAPEAVHLRTHRPDACPKRCASAYAVTISVPLRGPTGPFGDLWLGRRQPQPFSGTDRRFLEVLAELAVIAITHARILESERQDAILIERERIAREMHDSLAQVLGVTHIRLRALGSKTTRLELPAVTGELNELADICHEAYGDVREAILGLRESSQPDRPLLESLRAYVEKFSRQSGIATTLQSTLDHELLLSPRCEVQVIRVIQEALTNVRKHSGAHSAVVRISSTAGVTTFVVADDGTGFALNAVPTERDGFGLQTMRERIKQVNGHITIDAAPQRGTRIIVEVPGGRRRTLLPSEAVES